MQEKEIVDTIRIFKNVEGSAANMQRKTTKTFVRKEVYTKIGITLFSILCLACYSQALHKKEQICEALQAQIQDLEKNKELYLSQQEDLLLQIHSQEDPAWIEMVLKKRLGVVPEGQMKVYFKKAE